MNNEMNQTMVLDRVRELADGTFSEDDRAWLDAQLAASPALHDDVQLLHALRKRHDSEMRMVDVSAVRGRVFAAIGDAAPIAIVATDALLDCLPAYASATLGSEDRAAVEAGLAVSPELRAALALQRAIIADGSDVASRVSVEKVRERAMAAIRADLATHRATATAVTLAAAPNSRQSEHTAMSLGARIAAWFGSLNTMKLAPVLAVLVLVQAAFIGVQQLEISERGTRGGGGFAEVRTMRVRFVASATSEQITQALVASGARIVGGPNQFGDYWLASATRAREEMRRSLDATDLLVAPPIDDDKGPPVQ